MSVFLEVSVGEALDKLSILQIKKEFINDQRLNNVIKEYNYLYQQLNEFIEKYQYFYNILYKVNKDIWILQDNIRLKNYDQSNHLNVLEDILNLNDSRFNIKKKLNELTSSNFKEQKGYKIRKLFFLTDPNNIILLQSAVRYFAFLYDEVFLFIDYENYNNSKNLFKDDPFIHLIIIDFSENIENTLSQFVQNDDIISSGSYYQIIQNKITHSALLNNLQYKENNNELYDQLGLNKNLTDVYLNFE